MSNKNREVIETDDDLNAVSSCKKGDVNAFESIVSKYQKKMFNTAYAMVGDYDEACDIVQDTFISAFRNIKEFEGKCKFSTWLYTIVINVSKNHLKQMKGRKYNKQVSLNDPEVSNDAGIDAAQASCEPGIVEKLIKIEMEQNVRRCINSLDNEFKEILVLRDMQGFSYDEIGSMLEIPEGTVKSRLSRAREFIKECLKSLKGEL